MVSTIYTRWRNCSTSMAVRQGRYPISRARKAIFRNGIWAMRA